MKYLVMLALRLFEAIPATLILLLARIVVGLVFYNSGLTKVDGLSIKPATFFLFATEFKLPFLSPTIAAYMATIAELTLPWLLWAGLGTRFAASALFGMTLVIQIFVYPGAYVVHGLWAISLLLIMRFGAGAVSLDHLIRRRHLGPVE